MKFWNTSFKILSVAVLLTHSPLQAEPLSSEGDVLYETAYETSLPSPQSKRDKRLLASMLEAQLKAQDPYAIALNQFGQDRSVEAAEKILEAAQTQRQKALAFLCLAEAYFAKQDNPKTILYSILSLGTYPSETHDRQVQFYFKKIVGEPVSLLSSKEALLDKFRHIMQKSWCPKAFRGAFDAATLMSLLPQYPLQHSEVLSESLQLYLMFDNGYAQHAGVSIFSSILSAGYHSSYDFNVIEDKNKPISMANKERLTRLMSLFGDKRFRIRFITLSPENLPKPLQSFRSSHWPIMMFYKFLIPGLVTNDSRALYLDSDIIVRSDLTSLYTQDFKGAWFLGTRDVSASAHLTRLGHQYRDPYLNGGIILLNVQAFKEGDGFNFMGNQLDAYPDMKYVLKFAEQDMMGTLFQGKTLEIGQQTHMRKEDTFSNSVWNWLAEDHPSTQWSAIHTHFANIIHMEGNHIKPWKSFGNSWVWTFAPQKNNGVRNLYWSLREMSPWSQL